MKKMWNMLRGKARRDNRGMSFVEVLCAVAILALVAGVIGTVVVMSTRTYKKGISETGIQQEAQLAANNIGNMVKDACSVVYGESGQQYLENGEDLMLNPDSTAKMQSDGFTELSIVTNEKIQYTMTYDEEHSTLMYQEFGSDGSALTGTEIMANNIVAFTADTTDFKKSKTIKLNMTVEDKSTNRRIPMEYTMTSRNDAVDGIYVSIPDAAAIMFEDSEIVLVPGETYRIPLIVAGKVKTGEDSLDWVSWGALQTGALETVSLSPNFDYAEVRVPIDTASTSEEFKVQIIDGTGNCLATTPSSCTVLIRKVDSVQVTHSIDTTNSKKIDGTSSGMYETEGTVYTFTASVGGNELAKRVAYDYDQNYKIAQAVTWSYVLKINNVDKTAEFDTYFKVISTKEDALVPTFTIEAKKAMPAGLKLTVRATSKHASGVNKAASDYYDYKNGLVTDDEGLKGIHYGEYTLEARPTKMNQGLEITLEPNQDTDNWVALGMKGGLAGKVTFDFQDSSDPTTTAEYKASEDKVYITLGNDEKGSGDVVEEGVEPYTFTVDVLADGVPKTKITVHVCRIDKISIAVLDNFKDNKGNTMGLPTYDFRARFNVDNGSISDMQNVVKNLIQYKRDGTLDEDAVRRTLSSKITWELINHGENGNKVVYKDSVTCMAGTSASDKGEVKGSYTATYKNNGTTFYNIVNIKPARVENGVIKQLPEIDISPSADTDTGLPANYELKVTIEALHPSGINKKGMLYNAGSDPDQPGIWASASISGNMTIETPTQLVIVEPGQGTNDSNASDEEMVVPLFVTGGDVYSMTATITGNSSSDTKLSSYSSGNPYRDGNATSASNKRTWYLGLLIGKDEKGNDDGRIQVHIDGYNTSGKKIAECDFELGVRRVDKVTVKEANGKAFSDVNEIGNTVKLEAYPTGRGSKGTEFYKKQTVTSGSSEEDCRWEKDGHGKYQSPLTMQWTMIYNNQEKPLEAWTQYFETDTIKTAVDEDNYKNTVQFKLLKELPDSVKFRATSLHTLGTVSGTKYNKSGKEYGKQYGEWPEDGLITVSGGWKRGGTLDIAYNIPKENITYVDGRPVLVKDGQTLWDGIIRTQIYWKPRYLSSSQWADYNMQAEFIHDPYDDGAGIGGERGWALFEGKSLTEFSSTIYAWGDKLKESSYSAPYIDGMGTYIDMDQIVLKVNIGNGTEAGTIAAEEMTFDIPDVVFQYQNALPATSKQKGDSDGKWTDKNGNNTLKVYVTPDDTISSYKSYYKLSEGWEETYEKYTLLPSRYVGVINDDKNNDSLDERLFDFTVTNTTGEGNEEGRSYVNFTFSKNVRTQNKGKVVKMIYEYNPYLCNTNNNSSAPYSWAYGNYKKEELDEIDGCDGILEFHFVDANINVKNGVTMPEVRYCPTYEENKSSSATPNYYYISDTARFHIDSNGTTAQYQTGSAGKWTTNCSMTYANGKWTIQ